MNFSATIGRSNLECTLLARNNTSSPGLPSDFFSLSQHPQKIGWFPAKMSVERNADGDLTISIRRIHERDYSAASMNGNVVDVVNRRMAVSNVNDGGADIYDLDKEELLAEIRLPDDVTRNARHLAFDYGSGRLCCMWFGDAAGPPLYLADTAVGGVPRVHIMEIDFASPSSPWKRLVTLDSCYKYGVNPIVDGLCEFSPLHLCGL